MPLPSRSSGTESYSVEERVRGETFCGSGQRKHHLYLDSVCKVVVPVVLAIAKFPFPSFLVRNTGFLPRKSLIVTALLLSTQVACATPLPKSDASPQTMALQSEATPVPPANSAYRPVDVDEFISSRNLRVTTPREVALQLFADYAAESEGRKSEEMSIEYPSWDTAVVKVTVVGLADDSVGGMRYRLALENQQGEWEITQVVMQFKCQEGRGHQDWSGELCS